MKRFSYTGLLLLTLGQPVLASDDIQAAFKTSYQSYLDAEKNNQPLLEHAEKAYRLGIKIYGESSDNGINLALNYANALPAKNREQRAERYRLYNKVYLLSTDKYGESGVELIDPLLGIATNTESAIESDNKFEQAVELAEKHNQPELVANIQFQAAEHLSRHFIYKKYGAAKSYLGRADDYYRAHHPTDSVQRIKTDFLVASFATGKHQYEKAIKRLNEVVDVFNASLRVDHQVELVAHSRLIHLYEKTGHSDKATKHCLAIAQMVPRKDDLDPEPLYRIEPVYPSAKAKQGRDGSVSMDFEITADGFVKDIQVIEASGGRSFVKSAKEALAKWRYAPKFIDGQAISSRAKVRLDFRMGRP